MIKVCGQSNRNNSDGLALNLFKDMFLGANAALEKLTQSFACDKITVGNLIQLVSTISKTIGPGGAQIIPAML